MGYTVTKDKDDAEIINTGVTLQSLQNLPSCQHELYKAGAYVKCRKCTAMWFDPDNTFTLWNKKFKKK